MTKTLISPYVNTLLEVFSQVIHEQLSHIVASWLVSSVLPPAAQLVGI